VCTERVKWVDEEGEKEAFMDASYAKLTHIIGESVNDASGHRIGKVTQVACEPNTLRPEWLVVKTSRFGRPRLVPLDAAEESNGEIRLPFDRDTVLDAPVPEIVETPAASERMALLRHYRQVA
jgi:sporulation protein YlmC with PRC-barrel domain